MSNNFSARSSSNPSTDEHAIEAKLSGLDARLRQDREKARRSRQVMEEKCLMVQGELDAIKKQLENLQSDLQTIVEGTPQEEQLAREKETVHHLSTEVRFQHSELVHKLDKIEQARLRMLKENQERLKLTLQLRSRVQERRQKSRCLPELVQKRLHDEPCNDCDIRSKRAGRHYTGSLEDDILAEQAQEDLSTQQIQDKWLHLIRVQTQRYQQQAAVIERTNLAELKRVASGYEQHFAVFIPVDDSDQVDEDAVMKVLPEKARDLCALNLPPGSSD
ncbi:hypothetical protein ACA910_009699 [Epithemia clementina (nom. ined.)]